ncbi:peroxisomal membrane protein 11C isoform X1 [Phyllostomus discolor]|uniref:Peroxisomal membrane protein 11C isoform X1 n=1 Tax=Phyllostomus discolor TaxID=89673 RepID=A0A7E6CVV4_9CHIR|nr:peroxisomal membrane protein 11C isoform X1 [Phyllostomus discolor]
MVGLTGLAAALESYRGRDRLIRTLGYCSQLVGGVLVGYCPARSEVGTRLLVLSSQLSHCRTILRLFDDLAMFACTTQYGLGAKEEDVLVRCLSVLGNLADQLYYPCEHIAWAADTKILPVDSARWWVLSTAFWGLSLLLGIARSLWMVLKLRQQLRSPTPAFIRRRQSQDYRLSLPSCVASRGPQPPFTVLAGKELCLESAQHPTPTPYLVLGGREDWCGFGTPCGPRLPLGGDGASSWLTGRVCGHFSPAHYGEHGHYP